jgi:hypothetical protein
MNAMKRIVFSFVLFSALPGMIVSQAQSRHCTEEPVTTMTHWGGNERIEIDMRDKPVRIVSGIVLWPGDEPSNESLVQVFQRKPSDPLYKPSDKERDVPVAACVTGTDGVFAFSLPSGEYELRVSLNKGIDVTSVFVTVKHGWHRSKKIRVVMKPGT